MDLDAPREECIYCHEPVEIVHEIEAGEITPPVIHVVCDNVDCEGYQSAPKMQIDDDGYCYARVPPEAEFPMPTGATLAEEGAEEQAGMGE